MCMCVCVRERERGGKKEEREEKKSMCVYECTRETDEYIPVEI